MEDTIQSMKEQHFKVLLLLSIFLVLVLSVVMYKISTEKEELINDQDFLDGEIVKLKSERLKLNENITQTTSQITGLVTSIDSVSNKNNVLNQLILKANIKSSYALNPMIYGYESEYMARKFFSDNQSYKAKTECNNAIFYLRSASKSYEESASLFNSVKDEDPEFQELADLFIQMYFQIDESIQSMIDGCIYFNAAMDDFLSDDQIGMTSNLASYEEKKVEHNKHVEMYTTLMIKIDQALK